MSDVRHLIPALEEVCKYNVFSAPVMVQRMFSTAKEVVVFFQPVRLKVLSENDSEDWRIDVTDVSGGKRIAIVNKQRVSQLSKARNGQRLSQATLIATRSLSAEGWLSLPVIISADITENHYIIGFTRLPEVPGGSRSVMMGKSFEKVQVFKGR